MESFIVKGKIFTKEGMKKGIFNIDRFGIKALDSGAADFEGTLIPAPFNFHTHIGDSSLEEEPIGGIADVVGPGGIKMKFLENANDELLSKGIIRAINFMKKIGIYGFVDFREQGTRGINLIPEFNGINGLFLSRPSDVEEAYNLIKVSNGFGMSSISDNDFDFLLKLKRIAKDNGKLFSVHFSENVREDVEKLIALDPDFIVHGIEATDDDLSKIYKSGIYCVITPRSNIFYGKRPDYSRFIDHEVKLMLGTDNVFTTEPDIFSEMDILYRYQRSLNRISPFEILKMAIWNPRDFLNSRGIHFPYDKYIIFLDDLTEYEIVTRAHMFDYIALDL